MAPSRPSRAETKCPEIVQISDLCHLCLSGGLLQPTSRWNLLQWALDGLGMSHTFESNPPIIPPRKWKSKGHTPRWTQNSVHQPDSWDMPPPSDYPSTRPREQRQSPSMLRGLCPIGLRRSDRQAKRRYSIQGRTMYFGLDWLVESLVGISRWPPILEGSVPQPPDDWGCGDLRRSTWCTSWESLIVSKCWWCLHRLYYGLCLEVPRPRQVKRRRCGIEDFMSTWSVIVLMIRTS